MDIRDLEIFLAVSKHLHFSRAREEVHLSQPSVSVRISKLEDELQVKLFEQIGKKVALTEAGRLLEPYARRAVAALDDAQRSMGAYRGLEQGSLRIGASTTPGMYVVPRIIAGFKRRHPQIALNLAVQNTRQIEEGIINDRFDLGFVGGHLVGDGIEMIPWRTDELALIVRPGHDLARKKQVKPGDLAKETFIIRETGSATRAVVEKHLQMLDLSPEAALELGNPEAVKQAVRDGFGIAFLSKYAIEMELKAKRLVALKIKGLNIQREMRIIYRKGRHLGLAAEALIEASR